MSSVYIYVILVCSLINYHRVSGQLTLTSEQEKVFNFMSGGLSQIIWTEDALPSTLSAACAASLDKINVALNKGEEWPFRFLDATSKSASGMMDGTFSSFGDYDECLAIQSTDGTFTGAHCLVNLTVKATNEMVDIVRTIEKRNAMKTSTLIKLLQGVCMPSTCTPSDVTNFIESRMQGYPLSVTPVAQCDTQEANDWTKVFSDLSYYQIIAILFLLSIVSLVALGTNVQIADVVCQYLLDVNIHEFSYMPSLSNMLLKCSIVEGIMSLMICEENRRKVSSYRKTYILFVISEIILGAAFMYHFTPARLTLYRMSELNNLSVSWVVPFSSHAISSALCFAWGFKVHRRFQKKGLSLGKAISFLITTALCSSAIVALQVILPLLASGPIWNVTSNQVLSSCQQNWWTHLLLVANIFPSQCAPHLIIMSIFGQLLLVSLVIALIFTKNSFIATSFIFALLATFTRNLLSSASSLSTGVLLDISTDESNVFNYLSVVHNSLSSHAISFLLGTLSAHSIPLRPNVQRGPLMKIFAAIVILGSFYAPLLSSFHQVISPAHSGYFILAVKVIGCLGALVFTLINECKEKSSETRQNSSSSSSSSSSPSSKSAEETNGYKTSVDFSRANCKLAESMIYMSLLYFYFDYFTSRILLPVFPFTVLKRTLYSLVNIYSLSISFHLFILSPIRVITKSVFTLGGQ